LGAFDYDAALRSGFFEVLGDLFPDRVSARLLLESCGVGAGDAVPFGDQTSAVYWQLVGRDLDSGRHRDAGLDSLLTAALKSFPGNARLRAIQADFGSGTGVPEPTEIRVLVLMAEPLDNGRTLLGSELQAVQEVVTPAPGFRLSFNAALRPQEIISTLLRVRPHVVHLSGHGDKLGVFSAQTDQGRTAPVDLTALLGVLDRLDSVRLLILGACHLGPDSQRRYTIVRHEGTLPSVEAVKFASGFYHGLVHHRSYEDCFGFGQDQVKLFGRDPSGFRLVPGRDGAA